MVSDLVQGDLGVNDRGSGGHVRHLNDQRQLVLNNVKLEGVVEHDHGGALLLARLELLVAL